MRAFLSTAPYWLVCAAIGLAGGWTPMLFHGPIPEKWNYFYLDGALIVWGYYVARLTIGFWVGITSTPQQWWLRGPLCGALVMIPLGFVALGNPMCGPP